MKPTEIKKENLLTLKAKIKGLAEAGRKCNEFITHTHGLVRASHWDIKRSIGQEARYHLIAYALLRGRLYNEIEPNSNKDKVKSLDFNYIAQICQRHCYWYDRGLWNPANIQRLIFTGTMVVKVVA